MLKLTKKILNVVISFALIVCSICMISCNKIKTVEVSVQVYDYTQAKFLAEDDVNFEIELFRQLAPKTVDAIVSHIESGFYDDTFFYVDKDTSYSALFVGDLKFDENGNIVQNLIDGKLPSEIYGEFESNGVTGNNLGVTKGIVGLYRSYYVNDLNFDVSSQARNSGRATLFMPQETAFSSYVGHFCMFGRYDTEEGNANKALSAVMDVLTTTGSYDAYMIYYTGEYDASKVDENYGLEFHCILESEFEELEESDYFTPSGEQLQSLAPRRINVPKTVDSKVTASLKSVKVK